MSEPEPQPIWFHAKDPVSGWLSNFSPHPFTLAGLRWPSVEHYYQAKKCLDEHAAQRIRAAASPVAARKLGQDRSLAVRADWMVVRTDVMATALRAKFGQNRVPRERLVASGAAPLIHLSGNDRFWGRTREGEGENRLGEMLMALRREVAEQMRRG